MPRPDFLASPAARLRAFTLGWLLLASAAGSLRAADQTEAGVEISVDGLGWLGNRDARLALQRLAGTAEKAELDTNAVDDAAFLLMSMLTEKGFLEPKAVLEIESADGTTESFAFDSRLETRWPRTIRARALRLRVERGVRYHVTDVAFEGLHAVPADVARAFFRGERALFAPTARAYSPARAARGRDNLQNELRRRGYASATVDEPSAEVDARTGAVVLRVRVAEGPLWTVRGVQFAGGGATGAATPGLARLLNQPWSTLWQQDLMAATRRELFKVGYPDVGLVLTPATQPEAGGIAVDVQVDIDPGEAVRLGEVRFEGAHRTREAVLRRRVEAAPGAPLDPSQLEESRYRLARLGVFDAVDLRYEPATGPVRSPVFALREGKWIEANLLFGYGSYEELRGGIELRQFNLFGSAHRSRLLLMQSMKSSRGDYTYTVPELFGESIDGTARLFGLQRREFSFLRQEYGGSLQIRFPARWLGAEATAGYTFQALRNLDNALSTSGVDEKHLIVSSLDGGLVRDRRDNPLRPAAGYRLSAQVEAADHRFGGEVDYQRFELSGSYHRPLGGSLSAHAGLSHGFITTLGTDDRSLPVNRRFFPGGDASIRGYREGEAAPRGADGRFVGAKTYTLLSLELEQGLTRNFSVVVFLDGLGTAERLRGYPLSESLFSAGLGLRYHTLIGPVRLEYGRNLNPRAGDPGGTAHLSVGFPF